ncbi:suppressor of kinetochore protein mutant [Blastocladiella emersonii ATCC 22665]|nr:suppressor of kinetochore protein mutant [Blastocladiella emersonii ATCC 22665]
MTSSTAGTPDLRLRLTLPRSREHVLLSRRAARLSGHLRKVLMRIGPAATEIPLPPDTSKRTANRLVAWMEFHAADENPAPNPDLSEDEEIDILRHMVIPEWDRALLDPLTHTALCRLIAAAHAFEIKPLVDLACLTLARRVDACKDEEEIRKVLNLTDNLTEEEKAQIRIEYAWTELGREPAQGPR